MMLCLVALVALGAAAPAAATPTPSVELVPTPYGMRPKQCVVEVPDGAHVDEDADGLVVTHPLLGTYRHTADPLCSLPEYAPRPSLHLYRELPLSDAPPMNLPLSDAPPMNRSVAHCDIPPCTCDALPCTSTDSTLLGIKAYICTLSGTCKKRNLFVVAAQATTGSTMPAT